jgi:ABC-2 family transporter protein
MTWLTWRQSRVQALGAAAALVLIALGYGITGPRLASLYTTTCGTSGPCGARTALFLDAMKADSSYPLLYFAGIVIMYLTPLLIGAFWGAPLIARELESGTHRVAWNQSVTRRRWLTAKLGLGAAAAMAFAGTASLLVTWWAGPIEKAGGFPAGISQLSRFQPLIFGTRDIVPIGTAALAFTMGVTAGLLLRRVLPAMAISLAVFAAALVAMPLWVSPHLINPAQYTRAVTVNEATMDVTRNGQINDPVTTLPGAWILTDQVITTRGTVFTLIGSPVCATGTRAECGTWLASQHLFQHVTYQPASRYWAYQWYETGIWLGLALALSGLCFWRIRKA